MADNTDMNRAFPEMTIELGPSPTRTPATSQSPLRQVVDNALREILSWRPKLADPKGFMIALNQAFTGNEVDGHIEFSWTPHSYEVQADMGAVTGAQASIYARAKAALDQSVPLLEGLYPLRADADDQDTLAIRALVRDQFTELVSELGQVGGPRLQRVDAYFDALLGGGFTATQQADPEKTGGLIGDLREAFGFERVRINTIDEERNLTNFLILVDHVIALQQNWKTYQHFFDRKGNDVFLGTQLVLISRALAVVAESVQEFYFVMDSVFLGAAERQTLPLIFTGPKQPQMTIGELLGWIERFAAEEGPRIIRDSGKQGVIALLPTVRRLQILVHNARTISEQNTAGPIGGFHTERVRKGWLELDVHITQLANLIGQMRPSAPVVTSVDSNRAFINETVRVTVDGENFRSDARVKLQRSGNEPIMGTKVTVVSSTELNATFNLTNANAGVWTVIVFNVRDDTNSEPNGKFTDFTIEGKLLPAPPPDITSVTPPKAPNSGSKSLTIEGSNFNPNVSVKLIQPGQADIQANILNWANDQIIASVNLAGVQEGTWKLIVMNLSDGQTDQWAPFTVEGPAVALPPVVRSVVLPSAPPAENQILTITGMNFPTDAIVKLIDGQDSIEGEILSLKSTEIQAKFDLSDAEDGSQWTVVVQDLKTGQSGNWSPFTVSVPTPSLTSLEPEDAKPNQQGLEVFIRGRNFMEETQVEFGPDVVVTDTKIETDQILVIIDIPDDVEDKRQIVTVTNPGNKVSNSLFFNVTSENIG